MRVDRIADRLGADLAEEANAHAEEWSIRTLRKKIEQRIFHKRLFARCARGLYRRRRPEDDLPGGPAGPRARYARTDGRMPLAPNVKQR